MAHNSQEFSRMREIFARGRVPDVVTDHIADLQRSVFPGHQLVRKRCRDDFRHMLVLGNGQDLLFG